MGYNEASFEEGRSTSGYNIMWQGATVSWASTKQASTALSTCEAEIYALWLEAALASPGTRVLVLYCKEKTAPHTHTHTHTRTHAHTHTHTHTHTHAHTHTHTI